jgi:hypothetical protein
VVRRFEHHAEVVLQWRQLFTRYHDTFRADVHSFTLDFPVLGKEIYLPSNFGSGEMVSFE